MSPNEAYNTNEYGYSEIQEYNSNYKINREYSVFRDPGFHFIFPFHLVIDMEWTRGKLFSEQFYRITTEGYQLQKKTDFSYTFYNSLIVPNEWSLGSDVGKYSRICLLYRKTEEDKDIGQQYLLSKHKNIIPLYKMDRFMDLENPDDNRGYNTTPMQDYYSKSYFIGGTMNLISQETTTYEGSTSIKTKENFSYSSPTHNQITESSVRNSLGDVTTTKYKYASDITNNSIATQMSQQNILSNYLEKETTFNQTRILKETNDFKNIGNNVIRLNSSKVEKGISTDIHTLYTINYDGKANVSEVINADNSKTTLLYGYNNSLLIAKIENASKEEVASALGVSVANLHTIDESKLAQINNLRNNNTSLKEAQVTTYEHKPLVGVTKITDPKGVYMTYEYDGLNRLKWIKDHLGNILQEYQYNYKNN